MSSQAGSVAGGNFNPRSREGSDVAGSGEKVSEKVISIHAPARGATACGIRATSGKIFQSTLPRGERQDPWREKILRRYFNPRSREGSDACNWDEFTTAKISIHAPARGATADLTLAYNTCIISIHAPARGATVTHCNLRRITAHFNPRSREGSDCDCRHLRQLLAAFQSTLPRGERHTTSKPKTSSAIFQSTLPRGERRIDASDRFTPFKFQSTLPRGERHRRTKLFNWLDAFQSTLPRGERLSSINASDVGLVFQSTLPRGERRIQWTQRTIIVNFNPRSREGSDDCNDGN